MAIEFNGVDQGYQTTGMIDIPSGPFTALFFARPAVMPNDVENRFVWGQAPAASTSFLMQDNGDGVTSEYGYFIRDDGAAGGQLIETPAPYDVGSWSLFSASRGSNDTARAGWTPVEANPVFNSATISRTQNDIVELGGALAIAHRSSNNSGWAEIEMAEVAIVTGQLSEAELIDIATGVQPVSTLANRIFYLEMASADAVITDSVAGVSFDIVGSPTTVDGPTFPAADNFQITASINAPDISGLKYAIVSGATPNTGEVIAQGSDGVTSGGSITIQFESELVTAGETVFLVLTDSDGTTTGLDLQRGAMAPVTVQAI